LRTVPTIIPQHPLIRFIRCLVQIKPLGESVLSAKSLLFSYYTLKAIVHNKSTTKPMSRSQLSLGLFGARQNPQIGGIIHKKRPGRPPALDARAHRRLIRYVDQNPKETLLALCTPSKSGTLLSQTTTRKYLQKGERYAFRRRRKPFLKPEHKKERVR